MSSAAFACQGITIDAVIRRYREAISDVFSRAQIASSNCQGINDANQAESISVAARKDVNHT